MNFKTVFFSIHCVIYNNHVIEPNDIPFLKKKQKTTFVLAIYYYTFCVPITNASSKYTLQLVTYHIPLQNFQHILHLDLKK